MKEERVKEYVKPREGVDYPVNKPLPPLTREQAAEIKVKNALALIERAQNTLTEAAGELSPVIGGIPHWKRAIKLSGQCHAAWRKLAYCDRRKWKLDREV